MATPTAVARRPQGQTPYEHRLGLVAAALQEHTGMAASAAQEAAVSVLHSIDTIPESVR